MKKRIFAIMLLACAVLCSCKKDEVFTQYDRPDWAVVYGDASVSMTAVVSLPVAQKSYISDDDILAVFIGGECRGIAEQIDGLFYVNIVGTPDECRTLTFRYYSAKTKYLYQEADLVSFSADKILGTADEPYQLTLTIL